MRNLVFYLGIIMFIGGILDFIISKEQFSLIFCVAGMVAFTSWESKEGEMVKKKISKKRSIPARRTIKKRIVRGRGTASIIRRRRR